MQSHVWLSVCSPLPPSIWASLGPTEPQSTPGQPSTAAENPWNPSMEGQRSPHFNPGLRPQHRLSPASIGHAAYLQQRRHPSTDWLIHPALLPPFGLYPVSCRASACPGFHPAGVALSAGECTAGGQGGVSMTSNQHASETWVPSSPPVSELTKDRFHRLPEFSHWKGESLEHHAVRSPHVSPHPSPSVRQYHHLCRLVDLNTNILKKPQQFRSGTRF